MKPELIKASMLRTEEGKDFLAFFDFGGRLRTRDNAEMFLEFMQLIAEIPMTISYQDFDLQGQWKTRGARTDCAKAAEAIPMRDARGYVLVLSVPGHPPALESK